MAADPIIYCLENLTDYDQFERLCSDLMAGSGYPQIEPLGGRSDKGRDALHESRHGGSVTLFAYTVREDWERKLQEDCTRISGCQHQCNSLVFVCTASLSATDKDRIKANVHREHGWKLTIYDLERLRVALAGPLRHLIPKHPQIFAPPWFPTRGGLSISFGRDTLVIDHVTADHSLATWIARRLQLCGYSTWCLGTAPMGGESVDGTVRALIENRAQRYLPILSKESTDSPDFLARCALAAQHPGLVLPCGCTSRDDRRLASTVSAIRAIEFDSSWARGLAALLDSLEAQGVQKTTDRHRGSAIALRSFVPEPVTVQEDETLFSNVFSVEELPSTLFVFKGRKSSESDILAARAHWAFAIVGSGTYAALCPAPLAVRNAFQLGNTHQYLWGHYKELEGRPTSNIIRELVRRSLDVACYRTGLTWCTHRQLLYFPVLDDPQRRVSYTTSDGKRTTVSVTGKRQWGFGTRAETYHYQLAPQFRVGFDSAGHAWVTTRIYARVTQVDGTPFEGKAIGRRRRHLAKSWWNQHWLARTLAVMQAIASEPGLIVVGPPENRIAIATAPLSWSCPVSIDESAVQRIGDFQEEMAALRHVDAFDESVEGEGVLAIPLREAGGGDV
ncbi:MAG: hypothetical protein ACKVXR_04745 [Planctomycetota bacterium]